MPSLRSLLNKIKNAVKGKPQPNQLKVPKLKARFPGHFGVHATSRKYREGRVAQGLPQFTTEERRRWHEMPAESLQSFVYMGTTLPMHSSNVAAARYDIDRNQLTIWFHGGRKQTRPAEYQYNNFTEDEAILFAQYASKGGFVWDHIRVRGTKYGHRKPYRRVS